MSSEKPYGQNEQTEIILQTLSEGVCRIALDGRIVYANAAAQRMLGRDTPEKIIGKPFAEVFYGRANPASEFCPIDFVLKEGEISHVKTETFYRGSETFLVEYICVPLLENDRVSGAVISFQDVTERRDVELAVAQTREAALETARAKAAFLANMSHEIRTPLSGIVGTADLLAATELAADQQKYVALLKKSTVLLAHIVNDILDFSKLEAGKFERERIDFSPREIVSETRDLFEVQMREKDLKLELEIDQMTPELVAGDVLSVRQILNNFISNAIKFTERGLICLRIALVAEDERKATLRFSVRDTGIGIDEQTLKKLFQPFTQADSSMTRRFGGTGLGLAISRQLAEILGGEIGVQSKPEQGSTFWFECPFDKAQSVAPAEPVKALPANENILANGNLKILVVDDHPANLEITVEMLRQIGLQAQTAENGRWAIKACAEDDFDLILMDCQMPGLDGFAATEIIRQTAKDVRIIAFSASLNEAERRRCREVGMDDYLSKPFTKDTLQTLVGKYFPHHNLPPNLDLQENIIHHSLSKIIEPKILENLSAIEADGKDGFVFEILDVFFAHAEEQIEFLEAAFAAKAREAIRHHAHAINGSGANVGLTEISALFNELEKSSATAVWKDLEHIFSEANEKFIETRRIFLSSKLEKRVSD